MKKINILLGMSLALFFPLVCSPQNEPSVTTPINQPVNQVSQPVNQPAAVKPIICSPPQGMRVDYFLNNKANLTNQTFIMGRDQVSGMSPQIILNGDKTVSFVIGDASEIKSQPKAGNMQVLSYSEDQISFAGMVNNAPILATYYPKFGVLIYSQQSIWPGPDFQGARAVLFYSQCK